MGERSLRTWQLLREAVARVLQSRRAHLMKEQRERIGSLISVVGQDDPRASSLAADTSALLAATTWDHWRWSNAIVEAPEAIVVHRLEVLSEHVSIEPEDDAEAADAWGSLEEALTAELQELHRELGRLCRACNAIARTVLALPASAGSTWPLDHLGAEGDLRAEAIRQIAARNPELDLVVTSDESPQPLFAIIEEARPLEDLQHIFATRKAWAEIFHELSNALAPVVRPVKAKTRTKSPARRKSSARRRSSR